MDYYKILGINKGASDSEIKSAYRKRAKEHHPDKGGDADLFKEINEAYSVLSDPQSKSNYDTYGSAQPGQSQGQGGFNMNDVFRDFFGGGQGGNRQRVGRNIQVNIGVTISEILFGCKKTVSYTRDEMCNPCSGKGGTGNNSCTTCGGAGQHIQHVRTPFGVMETVVSCSTCGGDGQVITNPCTTCKGLGSIPKDHVFDVDMPAGMLGGMRMDIPQKGDYVKNGMYGSLFIEISEIVDNKVIRDDMDILIKANINITTAVLGGDFVVETPHGDMNIKIEPGTQGGHNYEYSNMGIPVLQANGQSYQKGDMLIITEVVIPSTITYEQRELYTRLKKLENGNS